jgi:GTP-binding protein
VDLSKKPQIVVLNKIDGVDQEIVDDAVIALRKVVPKKTEIVAVSAKSKIGVQDLLNKAYHLTKKQKTKVAAKKKTIPRLTLTETDDNWRIEEMKGGYVVHGVKIERFAKRTDFSNPHGVQRLRDILYKTGVMQELEKKKIEADQFIQFGDNDHLRMQY